MQQPALDYCPNMIQTVSARAHCSYVALNYLSSKQDKFASTDQKQCNYAVKSNLSEEPNYSIHFNKRSLNKNNLKRSLGMSA